MKKYIFSVISLLCIPLLINANSPAPYGVNAWNWPSSTCKLYKQAGIKSYRVMVDWQQYEPEKGKYEIQNQAPINEALESASKYGARLSLCVYGSPEWARKDPARFFSYSPEDYANLTVKCVEYCENKYPGIVEAVEVENEGPTNAWNDAIPVSHATWQRDASWYYADILKKTYQDIQRFNTEKNRKILVVMDGIWEAAYSHLDDLYQAGCKNYFDRINFHYYLIEQRQTDEGKLENPCDINSSWHFGTHLRYIKYIAENWGDKDKPVWLSEFGWRYNPEKDQDFEMKRARFTGYVMDVCRASGFVERISPYVGAAFWGDAKTGSNDGMSMIYVDNHQFPRYNEKTPLYKMFKYFSKEFPSWTDRDTKALVVLPPATSAIKMINPGFESGKSDGWVGITADDAVYYNGKYSGRQTAPANVMTEFYPVEKNKLYEVFFWINVVTENKDEFIIYPSIIQQIDDIKTNSWAPSNYYGISDTRNYPNGWRKIRFMYFTPMNISRISLMLEAKGKGTFWIDDAAVIPLVMPNTAVNTTGYQNNNR